MILSRKENGTRIEYQKDIPWKKKFAWFPIRVDDGRIVWLEYVLTVVRTRKWPIDFDTENVTLEISVKKRTATKV